MEERTNAQEGDIEISSTIRCPFYGFHYVDRMNAFIDSMGNQCPLVRNAYAPCRMEIKGEMPDWERCQYNNSDSLQELSNIIQNANVFRDKEECGFGEMRPIQLKDWMSHIIRGTPLPDTTD